MWGCNNFLLRSGCFFLIIPLTKHGGIVDAKRTRHCVTSRYVSAKPNDANRNVKPKDIMPSLVYFNWRNGQLNRLCDWSLVLIIWTWACHLEVEWAACHLHLHGNDRGLEVPHLQEENHISTLFIDLQQNEGWGWGYMRKHWSSSSQSCRKK